MQESQQRLKNTALAYPRVVFFDVGQTLLHACPDVPEIFTEVARLRGHDILLSETKKHMPAIDAFYEAEYLRDGDFWCSHGRAREIWLTMYRYLASLLDVGQDAEGIANAVYERYLNADCWEVYPDVKICLHNLKTRGVRLGVISNWDATLEDLLRKIGLLPYFDDVISSAVVGYRKPDRVIFELACEHMEIHCSDAVHVGDLVEADGDGAAGAGLFPVIIDRKGTQDTSQYACVESLEILPELLEQNWRRRPDSNRR